MTSRITITVSDGPAAPVSANPQSAPSLSFMVDAASSAYGSLDDRIPG